MPLINNSERFCVQKVKTQKLKTKNGKIIFSRCEGCGNKNSKFIKEQKASGFCSQLGIRTPLTKIALLVDILFYVYDNELYNQ